MASRKTGDQLGREVLLPSLPKRIISLVPSQTELLFNLGLNQEVIGITKFCVHPNQWLQKKTVIGGTKNFWFDIIDELQPDLIIGNKEENYLEGIERLSKKYPVWLSDVTSFENSLECIRLIGGITNKQEEANSLVERIQLNFEELKEIEPVRVLYLIWQNPWMAAGSGTFIDSLLTKIGFTNCLEIERYPTLTDIQIKDLNPELIFLSSEPYPFSKKHSKVVSQAFPNSNVILVDGEYFSWFGSRLVHAPSYFESLIRQI